MGIKILNIKKTKNPDFRLDPEYMGRARIGRRIVGFSIYCYRICWHLEWKKPSVPSWALAQASKMIHAKLKRKEK